MSVLRYAVVQCGAVWKVVGARRAMGHFTDPAAAASAGARLAVEALASGHAVEFLVQDAVGELKPHDPVRWPPRRSEPPVGPVLVRDRSSLIRRR